MVLGVEEFGQLVEDEPRVGYRSSEGVVNRSVQVMRGQDGISGRKPRPHHQNGLRRLVELAAGDGCLEFPERVADERQRLALDAEPSRNVVSPRRQDHVMGQDRERDLV